MNHGTDQYNRQRWVPCAEVEAPDCSINFLIRDTCGVGCRTIERHSHITLFERLTVKWRESTCGESEGTSTSRCGSNGAEKYSRKSAWCSLTVSSARR
jgi:hypothetical protein